jgi:hypothetical protein
MRVPTRLLTSLALVLGLPAVSARPAAPATDPSLSALETALENRLERLRKPPARPGFYREASEIILALEALGRFDGLPVSPSATDPAEWEASHEELETLATVALHVGRSKTPDPAVRLHFTAVRDTLLDFAATLRQDALTTSGLLLGADATDAVLDLVLKGDEFRDDGLERWLGEPGASAALLVQASEHQHQAAALAATHLVREAVTDPVDIVPAEEVMVDEHPPTGPFEVGVAIARGRTVPELTVAVHAFSTAEVPTGRGMQPASQATIGIETLLDVQPDDELPTISVEVPPFSEEARVVLRSADLDVPLDPNGPPGTVVDVDGDTAVIGAPFCCPEDGPGPHQVLVLERLAGGLDAWQESARLEMPAALAPSENRTGFGRAVAISGDTIAVGAPLYDALPGEIVSGAVLLFERGPDGTWAYTRTIAPASENPDLDELVDDAFGAALDLDGDWLVVGSPRHDSCDDACLTGTAYTFARDAGGPGAWGQVDDLVVGLQEFHGSAPIRQMGAAVALDGELLLVGDPVGSQAFVFELEGGHWTPAEDGWLIDDRVASLYGSSVAVAGSTLVVGAPGTEIVDIQDAGEVHVYERIEDCDGVVGLVCYCLVRSLRSPAPAPFDGFGTSVALSQPGNSPATQLLAVGSPGQDYAGEGLANAGSIHLYVQGHAPGCPPPSNAPPWGLLARRFSDAPAPGGRFGHALAIASAHLIEEVIDGEVREIEVPAALVVGEPFLDLGLGGAVHVLTGMDPVVAGEYRLAVEVDPHQRILEMENDQAEENNLVATPTTFQVCVPALEPDLAVRSLELVPVENDPGGPSTGFIVADTEGNQITRAGLNVAVELTGYDGPIHGARLSAWLLFPDGSQRRGRVLDPATGQYEADHLALPPLQPGETPSVHMDLEFDGPTLPPGNVSVTARVVIESPASDRDPSNDMRELPGQNWTAIVVADCGKEETYEKQMGNSLFHADIGFESMLAMAASEPALPGHGVYPGQEYGAVGSLVATVDFTVFGHEVFGAGDPVHAVEFRVLVERDPLYEHDDIGQGYGFFEASLEAVGYTLYSVGPHDSFSVHPPAVLPLGLELVEAEPPGPHPIGFAISKTFAKSKTFPNRDRLPCCLPIGTQLLLSEPECCERHGQSYPDNDTPPPCFPHGPTSGPCKQLPRFGRTLYPGGFPVDVDAAAEARFGLELAVEVSDDLKFDVVPFVGVGVAVDVAIPGGSPFQVGATGSLTIIEYRRRATTGLAMTPERLPEDLQQPATDITICGAQCFRVAHEVGWLSGRIKAFASYPALKLFGRFTTKKKEVTIVEWDTPLNHRPIVSRNDCEGPCFLQVLIGDGTLFCDDLQVPCTPSPCEDRIPRDRADRGHATPGH